MLITFIRAWTHMQGTTKVNTYHTRCQQFSEFPPLYSKCDFSFTFAAACAQEEVVCTGTGSCRLQQTEEAVRSSLSACFARVKEPTVMAASLEKSYDPYDRTLVFVDGKDDLDPFSTADGPLKAQMSCGHAVTPDSLTQWCRHQLDQGNYKFKCPALVEGTKQCNKPWSYQEVRRLADLTKEEMQDFEENIARMAAAEYCESQACPRCKSNVERKNLTNLCVQCSICTADLQKSYQFCWQCQRPWKGQGPRSDRCDNEGCSNKSLDLLQTCKTIDLPQVAGATNIPFVRACPTCGTIVEHSKKYCKNVVCPSCDIEFCFVCLKLKETCKLTSTAYTLCKGGAAPRQTSIPVRCKDRKKADIESLLAAKLKFEELYVQRERERILRILRGFLFL